MDLFDNALLTRDQRATIEAAFVEFHNNNPAVYETLERLAKRWFERGRGRCGIGMLFEVARWEVTMSTVGDDFKLNNNFRSRYVRLLAKAHPEWGEDFFEMRVLRTR